MEKLRENYEKMIFLLTTVKDYYYSECIVIFVLAHATLQYVCQAEPEHRSNVEIPPHFPVTIT